MAAPGTLIRAAPGRCAMRDCHAPAPRGGRCWRHKPQPPRRSDRSESIAPHEFGCPELWGVASWGEYPHAQSEAPTRRERNHRR